MIELSQHIQSPTAGSTLLANVYLWSVGLKWLNAYSL